MTFEESGSRSDANDKSANIGRHNLMFRRALTVRTILGTLSLKSD